MSSTLQIQQQLNALLEEANQQVEKLSGQYKTHVDLLEKVAQAAEKMNKALQAKTSADLAANFNEAANAATKAKTTVSEAMTEASQKTETASDSAKKLDQSVKDIDKTMKSLESNVGIIGGIGKAFEFALSGGFSFLSMLGSIASALFSVATAVITFPFAILSGLIKMASKGGSSELAQALNEIRKEFGYLKKTAGFTILSLSKSMKGQLANTGLSVWRTFGNLAERLKYFTEYAKNLGETVDAVFKTLSAGSAEALGAFNKGLGFTAAGQKGVAQRALASGQQLNDLNREIASYAIQLSDAFGVTMKLVSRDVGEMMADFEHFGNLSVRELTQAAVFARRLGIEVKSLGKLVDKFLNFEDAANSAAQLSQAFGMNIDAFKLMAEQDPAKKLQMLRDGFFAAGRTIENMTAQERRLLATQTGLGESELALAFSQKNRSLSYSDIKKKGDMAQKSQLTQAQALEKLSGAIDRLIKSGSAMQGGFFDRFLQGFMFGIEYSRQFRELMRALRQSLWIVYRAGVAVGRMFVELFPGVQDFLVGLKRVFNPADMQNFMNRVKNIFREFFTLLTTNPSTAMPVLLEKLQDAFMGRLSAAGPGGRQVLDGVKAFFTAIVVIASSLLKKAMEGITIALKYILDLLTGRVTLGALPSDGGFFATALAPLIQSISQAWPPLWEAFKNLFGFLFQKLKEYVMEALPPIITTVFKYAIYLAIAQGLTTAVVGGLGSAIGGMLKKLGTTIGGGTTAAAGQNLQRNGETLSGFFRTIGRMNPVQILKVGLLLVVIAGALAIGGVMMAEAIKKIAEILSAEKPEKIIAAIGILTTTALNVLILAGALKLVSKVAGPDLLVGVILMGLVLYGMIRTTERIITAFKDIDENKIKAVATGLLAMTAFIAASGVILLEALGIGALLSAIGPASAVILVGLAAMALVVDGMVDSITGILVQVSNLDLKPGYEAKINAFIAVFNAVSNFLKNFSDILSAIKPSWFDSIFSSGNPMKENIDATTKLFEAIVGGPGKGGIIGLLETVLRSLREITDDQIRRAAGIITIIEAIGKFIEGLTTPIKAVDAIVQRGQSSLSGAIYDITNFIRDINARITDLLGILGRFLVALSRVQIDENARKNIEVFSSLLSLVASIVTALTSGLKVFDVIQRNTPTTNTVISTTFSQLSVLFSDLRTSLSILILDLQIFITRIGAAVSGFNFSQNQIKFLGAVATIISAVLGAVSAFAGAIVETTKNSKPENVSSSLDALKDNMRSIMSSIGSEFASIMTGTINGIKSITIQPGDVAKITANAAVLKAVFSVLNGVGQNINAFGREGERFDGGKVWDKMRILGDVFTWMLDPRNEVGGEIKAAYENLARLNIDPKVAPNAKN